MTLLPGTAGAISFGEDDRVAVSREPGSPYDAIGLLMHKAKDGNFVAGTATLVSPCHVLTAHHVAGGGEPISAGTTATFYLGVGDKGPGFDNFDHFGLASKARAVAWGDYLERTEHLGSPVPTDIDQQNGWEDWALLELDTCLGETRFGHGYMRLVALGTRDLMRAGAKLKVRSVGFPVDRDASELWLDPDCMVLGQIYSSGWQHDCITLPGNSGGPIVARDEVTGEERLVAINVSHIGIEGIDNDRSDRLFLAGNDPTYYEYLSIGVPVSAFIGKVARYLPADPALDRFSQDSKEERYAKGSEDVAIADIGVALKQKPNDANLMLLRGLWLASKGEIDGALEDWSSVEKTPQLGPRARYHRARLLLELGGADTLDAVEDEFTALMSEFPENLDLRHYRGLARQRGGHWRDAIDDFSAVLKRRPESAVVFNNRGDTYRLVRDFGNAQDDYDQAVTLAPDWPEAWRDRGYLEHLRARYDKAEHDFQKALAINEADAEALNGLGLVALAKGNSQEASAAFDKAIRVVPKSGVYLANRGAASWIAGDLRAALGDFERSIALDPNEPYIRLFEFLALARLGERTLAQSRLQRYLATGIGAAWPRPIMDYYLGTGSLDAVDRGVRNAPESKLDGYRFDRDFYLGEWALVRGDKAAAIRRLRSVIGSELREYLEYDLARADLMHLGVKVPD